MTSDLLAPLTRIADALDRLTPPKPATPDLASAPAWVWDGAAEQFIAVPTVNRVDLALLKGIDRQKAMLLANTRQFAAGLPANNALLWGARGMGKSSLVKAIHATVRAETDRPLILVELHRDEIATLPLLLRRLGGHGVRTLLFCDDLSFDAADTQFKALKAVLEGGLEGRPEDVLFNATSNRRHLVPRSIMDAEAQTAVNPRDATDEVLALSDRFGLWIGFHACSQDDYLAMVAGYAAARQLRVDPEGLRAEALEWATTRGARSGRVAWQFIQDLTGRLGLERD
jgi:predicted AAA+ superfamily ATPase